MRLLYFNPWNDLALASNDARYTPPASARQMADDLSELPRLWALPGDEVCAPSSDGSFHLSSVPSQVLPWGWSPLAVSCLLRMGVPPSCLPDVAQLEAYRQAASRATAVRLLSRLRQTWPEAFAAGLLVGESAWCTREEEVRTVCALQEKSMLKMPWSGSGRGVRPMGRRELDERDWAWVRRTLNRQGGVEVEPYYNKVQDFALEYWAEGGRVSYEGLSVFETTAGGVYAGNLVASEQQKMARLAPYLSASLLREVSQRVQALLEEVPIPWWYTGPVGVDMMLVRVGSSEAVALHPLVEVNLRMTMGWVALQLKRKLPPGGSGTFKILFADGHYLALFPKNAPK